MILHERTPTQVQRPRLGGHLSIAGGLPSAIDRAAATGCETLQIFTKSSNQWRARPFPDAEVKEFRRRAEATGINPIFAHASYLINLASPDKVLRDRSVAALFDELRRADLLGLAGVILHPGAYTTGTEKDGLRRIADGVGKVMSQRQNGRTELLLEHTAGQGTVIGHRFEQLKSIIDESDCPASLGICLDTCHLIGAGYDIISAEGYTTVFDLFQEVIGLERLKVFHLNDSKKPLKSRLDRHEHIGRGYVGVETFRRLLWDDRFASLPMLIETPKAKGSGRSTVEANPMDLENLALLRNLRDSASPP